MEWQYPALSTLRIDNGLDQNGNLIVTGETATIADHKTLSFKGFKTPTNGQDASSGEASLTLFCDVILGIFNLGDYLVTSEADAQITAKVTEE